MFPQMSQQSFLTLALALFSFFPACQKAPTPKTDKEMAAYQEPLVKINRFLVKKDREAIRQHIDRYHLSLQESPTGLWYQIKPGASQKKAREGDIAIVDYQLSLLDGTLCYSTDSLGSERFTIGSSSEVETGLTEGILMMHEGDQATFILPPHLAQGLAGSHNIPPRSILVYRIKLLSLRQSP
jgi:FKBP-type peptidyl-prolyl cis-trans isomerase FkpA